AAQDDVTVLVTGRRDDGRVALLGHGEEVVRRLRGANRVHGDAHVAVRAVLEADRAGESGGQLAVDLALGSARTDGAPGDQVRDVLRRDHVQVLAAGGNAIVREVQQELTAHTQALVNVEAAVQVGVVDQALPTDGGTRFFKIDAHDHQQVVGVA